MKGKDILCAIDFSASSMDAMKWSFDVAMRTKAKVVVLFCYRLMAAMHDEETASRKRRIESEALKKFQDFVEKHPAGQSVTYQFIAEPGYPHFRIEMFLHQNPVGLLVVASSLVEHFDENKSLGFGKFIKSSRIPLVVVPHYLQSPSLQP